MAVTQYLKFSDYQLVSIKKHSIFFAIYVLRDESPYVFGEVVSTSIGNAMWCPP
jgi:hypothetical protein